MERIRSLQNDGATLRRQWRATSCSSVKGRWLHDQKLFLYWIVPVGWTQQITLTIASTSPTSIWRDRSQIQTVNSLWIIRCPRAWSDRQQRSTEWSGPLFPSDPIRPGRTNPLKLALYRNRPLSTCRALSCPSVPGSTSDNRKHPDCRWLRSCLEETASQIHSHQSRSQSGKTPGSLESMYYWCSSKSLQLITMVNAVSYGYQTNPDNRSIGNDPEVTPAKNRRSCNRRFVRRHKNQHGCRSFHWLQILAIKKGNRIHWKRLSDRPKSPFNPQSYIRLAGSTKIKPARRGFTSFRLRTDAKLRK